MGESAETIGKFKHLFYCTWPFCLILAGNLGIICGLLGYGLLLSTIHFFRAVEADNDKARNIFVKGSKLKKSPMRSQIESYQLVAHRGGGFDAPENTLESIREAAKNGVDAVEVDIAFSKDGHAILMHDDTVDRTTDGKGCVGDLTFEELRQLDAAARHPLREKFSKCRIPTIDEVIKECLELDVKIYLDCKRSTDPMKIIELYKIYPALYNNAVVCCFFPWIVYAIGRKDSKIVRALTHRDLVNTYNDDYVTFKQKTYPWIAATFIFDKLLEWCLYSWVWYLCGASAWVVHTGNTTRNFVRKWRKAGLETIIWTPNSPILQKYFGDYLGCPIITDTLRDDYIEDEKKKS